MERRDMATAMAVARAKTHEEVRLNVAQANTLDPDLDALIRRYYNRVPEDDDEPARHATERHLRGGAVRCRVGERPRIPRAAPTRAREDPRDNNGDLVAGVASTREEGAHGGALGDPRAVRQHRYLGDVARYPHGQVSRGVADLVASQKRLTDMAYGSQSIADMFRHREVRGHFGTSFAEAFGPSKIADVFGTSRLAETFGPSYLADVLGTRQKLSDVVGTTKFAAMFEPPKIASMVGTQQTVLSRIRSGAFADVVGAQPRIAERIGGQIGANFAPQFKHRDLFASQQRLAERLRVQTNYADAFKTQRFADLMQSFTVPRAKWSSLLSDLATAVSDADAFAEFAAELDEADAATEVGPPTDVWWVYRLPLVQQYLLYVAALKIVDELSKFMADLVEIDVPTEVRNGTQVLFAVVGFLLLVMEAKSKRPEDD